MIRQAYENREISKVAMIPGAKNPADALTKVGKRNGSLSTLLQRSRFTPHKESGIERTNSKTDLVNAKPSQIDETKPFSNQKVAGVSL